MAKKKISGLPAGSALNGTELVPIVQTGTTKRITTQDIANLGNSSGVEGSGTIGTLAKFTASSTIGDSLLKETANAIGFAVTPKAWGNNNKVIETTFSSSLIGRSDFSGFGRNFFYNSGDDPIYSNNGFANAYIQSNGEHLWINSASGTAGNTISFTQPMTLTAAGNLGLGKTAPLGILHLYKAGAATRVVIDGDAAQNRIITYRTNGVQRFGLYVNNTAESGSNAGSDFAFRAYSDAGTLLSTPLFIKRSTGAATFSSSVTAADAILSNVKPSLNFTLSVNPAFSHSIVGENYSSGAAANNYMDLKVANASNSQQLALRLYGDGAATFTSGLALSAATAPASGIEFPATQVASTSANNLDDYEEGTWTPIITFGNASVGQTYTANSGSYVKIGRQVTINCYVEFSNKGTSTGGAVLTGLPFTLASGNAFYSAPSVGNIRNINFINVLSFFINQASSIITMGQTTNLGAFSVLTDTNFANNGEFILTATYFV